MRQEKGSAGLNILLSVIILLFIIGLVIFVFAIMGGGLSDAVKKTITGSIVNESIIFNDTYCVPVIPSGQLSNVVVKTQGGATIDPSEYTVNGNCIQAN